MRELNIYIYILTSNYPAKLLLVVHFLNTVQTGNDDDDDDDVDT